MFGYCKIRRKEVKANLILYSVLRRRNMNTGRGKIMG